LVLYVYKTGKRSRTPLVAMFHIHVYTDDKINAHTFILRRCPVYLSLKYRHGLLSDLDSSLSCSLAIRSFKFQLRFPHYSCPLSSVSLQPSFSITLLLHSFNDSHHYPVILISVSKCFFPPQVCHPGFLVVPCCFPLCSSGFDLRHNVCSIMQTFRFPVSSYSPCIMYTYRELYTS
jgi:hypothetical protein